MHKSNVWLATALINQRVRNSAGENLGKIEDVVVDPLTGNLQYAILSFGGVLGMGSKLFAIPWTALELPPARDYVLLNVDKESLERAPGFDPKNWPDMSDPVWRRSIHDYYDGTRRVTTAAPGPVPGAHRTVVEPVVERDVYAERPTKYERRVRSERPARQGMSFIAGVALVVLILGLAWTAFLVSTRGWDQARQDIKSSLQGAAYAAKETTADAALTTKVKSALSLSKRIPSDQINVDSEGDIVTLRGEVPSDQVRDLAEQIARDVPGVREVHNHLFAMTRTQ